MNLIFDLDGTLTDPKQGIVGCIQYALAELGHDPAEYPNLERFIGPPLLGAFRELLNDDVQAREAVHLYRERFSTVGLFENKVYDGIVKTLDSLADSGNRMLVATSKPKVYADRIIEHFGLGKYFDYVYGSELNGKLSDKSELIAFVLDREPLEPSVTCMIGDRFHDIVGAKANSVRSVGVLWGYGSKIELTGAGADAICETPLELASSVAHPG